MKKNSVIKKNLLKAETTIILLALLAASITTKPSEEGKIKVIFCPSNECKNTIIDLINNSNDIKCAFYDLNETMIENALKKKISSKKAEVLVYEKNFNRIGLQIKGSHGGLMHNKFCIFDNEKVMTGSANPTNSGLLKNDNNIIIIEGKSLAKNYLDEFKEFKGSQEKKVKNPVIRHKTKGREIVIENYFCPEDDCEGEVLEELNKAGKEVYFMTFSFTSDKIGKALSKKSKDGIRVEGIFEARQKNKYWELPRLVSSGAEVMTDKNPAMMHNKVFIIDPESNEATVITGSYNPTKNGNKRNDENIIIIHDKILANNYLEEYRRIKEYN